MAFTPKPTTIRAHGTSDDVSKFAASPMGITLSDLRRRWQPGSDDGWMIPTLAQQRADAFAAFFLRLDISLTTEVVLHVRGDGNTFDDGTERGTAP